MFVQLKRWVDRWGWGRPCTSLYRLLFAEGIWVISTSYKLISFGQRRVTLHQLLISVSVSMTGNSTAQLVVPQKLLCHHVTWYDLMLYSTQCVLVHSDCHADSAERGHWLTQGLKMPTWLRQGSDKQHFARLIWSPAEPQHRILAFDKTRTAETTKPWERISQYWIQGEED